jgi:hypothetical protein
MISILIKNRQLFTEKMSTFMQFDSISSTPMSPNQMQKLVANLLLHHFRIQNVEQLSTSSFEWCANEAPMIDHLLKLFEQKNFNSDREIAMVFPFYQWLINPYQYFLQLFFIFSAFLLELPTRICIAFNPMSRLVRFITLLPWY